MFSRFFIDRPIFAAVLSIVITLAGAIALATLPISQFPPITPPTVQVDCIYPGASAKEVSEAVAVPIEQQVNGVEGMLYMSSQCTNDGGYNLMVTFKHGINLNMAQVLVQNRVSLALPMLPEVIKRTGVTTRKRSPDTLLSIGLFSTDDRYDQLYLSNYALMQIREELLRVPGVSEISMLGQRDYSMRIWIDPEKLAARDLTAGDVVRALRQENVEVAAGQLGQPPGSGQQPHQLTVATLGRLEEPEQFENVIVKATPQGHMTRLRDVAREVNEGPEVAHGADSALAHLAFGQFLPELLARLLALFLQQGTSAHNEIPFVRINFGDQATQPLVDELLRLLDAVEVDLADRHEAADAVDIHRQAALVGLGHAGLDDHALGDR